MSYVERRPPQNGRAVNDKQAEIEAFENRLAEKIARCSDRYARRRLIEMWQPPSEAERRKGNKVVAVCFAIAGAIIYFALHCR